VSVVRVAMAFAGGVVPVVLRGVLGVCAIRKCAPGMARMTGRARMRDDFRTGRISYPGRLSWAREGGRVEAGRWWWWWWCRPARPTRARRNRASLDPMRLPLYPPRPLHFPGLAAPEANTQEQTRTGARTGKWPGRSPSPRGRRVSERCRKRNAGAGGGGGGGARACEAV